MRKAALAILLAAAAVGISPVRSEAQTYTFPAYRPSPVVYTMPAVSYACACAPRRVLRSKRIVSRAYRAPRRVAVRTAVIRTRYASRAVIGYQMGYHPLPYQFGTPRVVVAHYSW